MRGRHCFQSWHSRQACCLCFPRSGHPVDDGPLVLVEDEGSRIHLSITPSGTDSAAGAPPGARHVDAVAGYATLGALPEIAEPRAALCVEGAIDPDAFAAHTRAPVGRAVDGAGVVGLTRRRRRRRRCCWRWIELADAVVAHEGRVFVIGADKNAGLMRLYEIGCAP